MSSLRGFTDYGTPLSDKAIAATGRTVQVSHCIYAMCWREEYRWLYRLAGCITWQTIRTYICECLNKAEPRR